MGRRQASSSYITPIKDDGTVQKTDAVQGLSGSAVNGTGSFTLAAGTYFFPLGGQDATVIGAHIQWDASIAFVATIEDTCFPEKDALDYSTTTGEWIDEDPSTAFVGTVGAGANVTNGVLTLTAGSAGGALFHVVHTGARRTRLKVVVGTPGNVRVAAWGKE